MHPRDCPEWEYEKFPNHEDILKSEARKMLSDLKDATKESAEQSS